MNSYLNAKGLLACWLNVDRMIRLGRFFAAHHEAVDAGKVRHGGWYED